MKKTITDRFFSFARRMFFDEISPKFSAGPFKNIMDFFYIIFEKIAFRFDILSFNYLKMYEKWVDEEIKMANISSNDLLLLLGSGSLPATSILIAMKTKVTIVSIDNDLKAIHNGSRFIKKFDLEKLITLEHADGLNYPVDKFDVIFVLYGVKKQRDILNHLAKNMKKEARIVFRTITDDPGKLPEGSIELSTIFQVKDCILSEMFYPMGSYLLLKKNF